jgi:hypothetical protein
MSGSLSIEDTPPSSPRSGHGSPTPEALQETEKQLSRLLARVCLARDPNERALGAVCYACKGRGHHRLLAKRPVVVDCIYGLARSVGLERALHWAQQQRGSLSDAERADIIARVIAQYVGNGDAATAARLSTEVPDAALHCRAYANKKKRDAAALFIQASHESLAAMVFVVATFGVRPETGPRAKWTRQSSGHARAWSASGGAARTMSAIVSAQTLQFADGIAGPVTKSISRGRCCICIAMSLNTRGALACTHCSARSTAGASHRSPSTIALFALGKTASANANSSAMPR